MTKQEKAKSLVKYYKLKDVALFEIDKFLNMLLNSKYEYKNTINYWNEIRQEIELL
jgi:hypothetical protein